MIRGSCSGITRVSNRCSLSCCLVDVQKEGFLLHHYTEEGMDPTEFCESEDNLKDLESEYT